MIDNGFPSETDIPLEVAETYQLTTEERDALLRATEFETSLKLRIYELQTQLEAVQRELIGAGAQGRGARAMLVQTRGWKDAILSDDLATLTRRK